MPLPSQIPVRYTEEDAGFVSVRPVVNQTFQLHELVDMVVSVAGKDAARVQQIFRTGTVIYNGYRYWWDALPADREEIEQILERASSSHYGVRSLVHELVQSELFLNK